MGFIAILHFPHLKNPKIKRVHRLVVLPDYQGIGIGIRLLNKVGDYYKENGFDFRIVTSTPALVHSLKKRGWILVHYGRGKKVEGKGMKSFNATASVNRNIMSFKYINKK